MSTDSAVLHLEYLCDYFTELLEVAADDMWQHRLEEMPYEAVGLLCDDGFCATLINQARSDKRFEVSKRLLGEEIEALQHKDKLPVAVYHSHVDTDADPSQRDKSMMADMPGVVFAIVGIDGISAWVWDDDRPKFVTKVGVYEQSA